MTLPNDIRITPELVKSHGLKPDEYDRFVTLLGREPTLTELGICSAMWNEHCSYKSSKKWLKTMPTKGPRVIQGPGENAGVIDIGDGDAIVFKMESHNHPSFIEPYQGAATGVGGILRDVFTMGARPIAAMNALRFGEPSHPRTRHLVSGVVHGIGGYGNSFGVPTIGGEVNFHPRYNGNILVNAMAVGLARADSIFYSKAKGVGLPVVYLGAKTGRDGIHGATMASAEFDDKAEEKRPTVQVGDPFTEKCLLEACLELMASGAVIAIQDMGAAGLTSSAVEMGAKGDLGIELDLDKVPCREEGMTAYEMMLSESQERMLMVLRPEQEKEAEAIFHKWGLDFAIVGKTTDTLRFVIRHEGEVKADLPIKQMGDQAPEYDRPWVEPKKLPLLTGCPCPERSYGGDPEDRRLARHVLAALGVGAVRPSHPVQHRADPRRRCRRGAHPRQEGHRRLDRRDAPLCRGRSLRGRQAGGCRMLAQPHGGGVADPSRSPTTSTSAIRNGPRSWASSSRPSRASRKPAARSTSPSSPAMSRSTTRPTARASCRRPPSAASGCLKISTKMATLAFKSAGDAILLIGGHGTHLGQSIYLREVLGREEGAPPPVDLAVEKRNGDFVREPDQHRASHCRA